MRRLAFNHLLRRRQSGLLFLFSDALEILSGSFGSCSIIDTWPCIKHQSTVDDDEFVRRGTYEKHQTLSQWAPDQGMTSLQAELTKWTLLLISHHPTVGSIQMPVERRWLMLTLGILRVRPRLVVLR
jgi:hypothetical protein